MQNTQSLILLLVLYSSSLLVFSSEDLLICAKFRENYRWSKGYELNALITKGNELNRSYKTHDFRGHSTYAIIYLDNDEPKIIELSSSYLLGDGTTGEDQHGKRWKISKSTICF